MCVADCPQGAITLKGGVAEIDQALCTKCGKCFDSCYFKSIRPNSENASLRGGRGNKR